jgi:hypothetical protein
VTPVRASDREVPGTDAIEGRGRQTISQERDRTVSRQRLALWERAGVAVILLLVIAAAFYGGFGSRAAQGMSWAGTGILTALRGANSLAFGQPVSERKKNARTMAELMAASAPPQVPSAGRDPKADQSMADHSGTATKTIPPKKDLDPSHSATPHGW